MPLPWYKKMRKKRSVERDYKFYDPPSVVWDKMNQRVCEYVSAEAPFYRLRDLVLMCVLYLSTSRISEIVRAEVKGGFLPSVRKNQFVERGEYVMLRQVPVVKRMRVKEISDYPFRHEIPLPRKGGLKIFTEPIDKYLEKLTLQEELFKFGRMRGYYIVNHITDEFPHYLREMGLKMWLRLFDRDLVRLQEFSGHAQLDNLARYLRSTWEESSEKILSVKLDDL